MTNVLKQKLFLSLAGAAMLAGVLAVALISFSPHARAADSSSPGQQQKCSLATLKGQYASNQSGFQITGTSKGPFATAATYVFDGRGHEHGITTRSVNGVISRHLGFTGTYTLNRNCTGTETVTDSTGAVRHYDFATVPSGSRFTFIRTDPGVVGSGFGDRG
jgi:uncharacterized membrane protein